MLQVIQFLRILSFVTTFLALFDAPCIILGVIHGLVFGYFFRNLCIESLCPMRPALDLQKFQL